MQTLPRFIKKYLAPLCLFTLIMASSQTMAYPNQVIVKNEAWSGNITIYGYENPSHWVSCGRTGELKPGQSSNIYCSKGVQVLTDDTGYYQQADGCKTEDLAKYTGDVVALVKPGYLYGFYCRLEQK